jgi:hypothetical protein
VRSIGEFRVDTNHQSRAEPTARVWKAKDGGWMMLERVILSRQPYDSGLVSTLIGHLF